MVVKGEENYGPSSSRHGRYHVLRGNHGWAGMRSLIRIAPEARFATIILSNGGSGHLTKTTENIMQVFLGLPGDPETIASESLPMTKAEMSSYVGTYENERVMTLFLKDGRLLIRDDSLPARKLGSLTDGAGLPVVKVGKNLFSISPIGTPDPTLFTLIAGDNGRIEFLHIGGRALKRK